jgi:hypothetical protein
MILTRKAQEYVMNKIRAIAERTRGGLVRWRLVLGWLVVLLLAVSLRSAGLFRGLDRSIAYHPDETKQVAALSQFLDGSYVWYPNTVQFDCP